MFVSYFMNISERVGSAMTKKNPQKTLYWRILGVGWKLKTFNTFFFTTKTHYIKFGILFFVIFPQYSRNIIYFNKINIWQQRVIIHLLICTIDFEWGRDSIGTAEEFIWHEGQWKQMTSLCIEDIYPEARGP